MLRINSEITIPHGEFRFRYDRSSGPGGQNVNKVNSKVTLHWPLVASPSLPEEVRERLLARTRRRVNSEGELVITSQRYRDRERNIQDCLEKLRVLILEAAIPPTPRKKTRKPRAANARRLREKRAVSERKQGRRSPPRSE